MKRFFMICTILWVAIGGAKAQTQATQVLTGTNSSPAILTDSSGNIYYANGRYVVRFNEHRNQSDTITRILSSQSFGISGLTMGSQDTVIYCTVSDTVFAVNLLSKRYRKVSHGLQYPTNLAYRHADGLIYATETGFDNGRAPTLGAYNPATGVRTFIAGEPRLNLPNVARYVNDTGAAARFAFQRPNGSFRERGALAFNLTEDTLYVADPSNRCIRWVCIANKVVGTLAGPLPGVPQSPLFRDSTRHGARFFDLYGLAVDKTGAVLVADAGPFNDTPTYGNRVRKIPFGKDTVYTLAGNGAGQGAGVYNNMDFIPGIGKTAMIGMQRGLGISKGRDTVYVSLQQRTIKLTKRRPTLTFTSPKNYLVGSGASKLVVSGPVGLTVNLASLSAPANVTLSNDTITVPGNAAVGTVTLLLSTNGDADNWLPFSDTIRLQIIRPQVLTLKKVRDYYYGEAPFRVLDSVSISNPSGRASVQVVSMAPANTVAFDTTTQTFTINSAGTVIYRAVAFGNDTLANVTILDTFNILKADTRINYSPIANQVFGSAPINLNAEALSLVTGLATNQSLTISVSALANVATYNPTTRVITLVGTGTVTVRILAPATANYNAAVVVQDTFLITKAQQVLTVDSIPTLFIGTSLVSHNLVINLATPNTGQSLQFAFLQVPSNVSFRTTPPRIEVPTFADTGWAVLRVIIPGNNNFFADTVIRRFRIERVVSLANTFSQHTLEIWPNPASDFVTIKIPASYSGLSPLVSLRDLSGKTYNNLTPGFNGQTLELPVAELPKGLWIVSIQIKDAVYTARLIKQ